MYEIYKHTCKTTCKSYVGQTFSNKGIEKRWKQHVSDAIKCLSDLEFHLAIRFYGAEDFDHEVLEETDDCKRESFWIKELNTKFPNGYNLTDGCANHNDQGYETGLVYRNWEQYYKDYFNCTKQEFDIRISSDKEFRKLIQQLAKKNLLHTELNKSFNKLNSNLTKVESYELKLKEKQIERDKLIKTIFENGLRKKKNKYANNLRRELYDIRTLISSLKESIKHFKCIQKVKPKNKKFEKIKTLKKEFLLTSNYENVEHELFKITKIEDKFIFLKLINKKGCMCEKINDFRTNYIQHKIITESLTQ